MFLLLSNYHTIQSCGSGGTVIDFYFGFLGITLNPHVYSINSHESTWLRSKPGARIKAITKHAHRLGFEFEWQLRFYDHIIRDDGEFLRISEYIENNPLNWDNDRFNNNGT